VDEIFEDILSCESNCGNCAAWARLPLMDDEKYCTGTGNELFRVDASDSACPCWTNPNPLDDISFLGILEFQPRERNLRVPKPQIFEIYQRKDGSYFHRNVDTGDRADGFPRLFLKDN